MYRAMAAKRKSSSAGRVEHLRDRRGDETREAPLNVVTKDGLLSKVAWSRTDAAVAAEPCASPADCSNRFELEKKEQEA
jgi:hypothetical protein